MSCRRTDVFFCGLTTLYITGH